MKGPALALLLASAWLASGAEPTRPNIVVILADDMGFSDARCYGGEIQTPNLDRLAAGGLRFSQFYNCALCGPSRSALMTGLHPSQVGIFNWTGKLNDRCVTIFELLKRAGYRTGAAGRLDMVTAEDWHDPACVARHVDRFLGNAGGGGPGHYFKAVRTMKTFMDGKPFTLPENCYKTDLITDFAVNFIDEAATKPQPFFLYVAEYAPHWPLHAKEQDMARYHDLYRKLGWDEARARRHGRLRDLGIVSADCPLSPRDARVPTWLDAPHKEWEAERMAAFAAQVDSLDQSVGRIMDALHRTGAGKNTLVLFLSDNGASDQAVGRALDRPGETWRLDGTPTRVGNRPDIPPGRPDTFVTGGPPWANVSNTPFREHKQTNFEGGIATPLIAWWPPAIPRAGAITHEIGHITDIAATCLDAAGVAYPGEFDGRSVLPIEGESLLPILKGGAREGHRTLCWATSGCRAIREGQWKLVASRAGPWELFDLASDRAESRNLADASPAIVKDLAAKWERWADRCGALPRVASPAQPRRGQQESFPVAAFGAKGDGVSDDGAAIQRALDAAIAAGRGAEVMFDPGKTYRLAARMSQASALSVAKAQGLAVSGNGATLVGHPSNGLVAIFDSRDVTVRDLTLDYDPLPFTQARLTGVRPAQGAVELRVEPGYSEPDAGDERLYRDFKSSDAVFLDGATREFTHRWGRIRSVKPLGDGGFEARFHGADAARRLEGLRTGDFIAIKRHFPAARPTRDGASRFSGSSSANILVAFSHNIRFERVVSHAAPSMTFVATGSEGVALDGCKVIRKPNTDRLVAGNSDGAHFKSLTVMPQVRDSIFEALMDDSINIKISAKVVKEVHGARVRLAHGDILTDDIVIEPGQSLLFLGGSKRRHLGYAKVAAVERVAYREAWVTLEPAMAGLAAGDLAFLRPVTDALVNRCEFRTQLKTALLVYPPAMVSDCAFSDVAYGVHAPFPGDIEGPPPSDLRVSRCVFHRPSVAAIALHLPSIDTATPGGKALVAEHCQITMSRDRGHVLSAFSQRGILLRDLRVTVEDGRPRTDLIRMRNCIGIQEQDVIFIPREESE